MTSAADGSLLSAFDGALAASTAEGSAAAKAFVEAHRDNVSKVLGLFAADGRLLEGTLPASCFNDFYKWTMFPVVTCVEQGFRGAVRCTFSVNIRDQGYRKQLYESATGKASSALFDDLKNCLEALKSRPFDRKTFERVAGDYKLPGWGTDAIDSVCGPSSKPRNLIQEFRADVSRNAPSKPSNAGNVLVDVFVAHDEKLGEDRLYIEATGPWHRVTWLETSVMQAVYDSLLRDRKRKEYGEEDASWYSKWLVECFCRCTRSVASAIEAGLKGALFTGRRTGGLALMMLQGLYVQDAFKDKDGTSMMLGTSSVTAVYMSLDAGVTAECVPRCAGTHAHELSMVLAALLGDADDEAGMPLSQMVGHSLYFYESRPQGDVQDPSRKVLMPMLPDTLGTRAFMKTAQMLKLPLGPHSDEPLLSVIGSGRQDSGTLEAFKKVMDEFDYKGAMMASEIEIPEDLFTARDNSYKIFGAGGFMGDSEKAWDTTKKNISMASKVLRVYVKGRRVPSKHTPVKTGETSGEGLIKEDKFEADGTLSSDELKAVKERAQVMATADPKLDATALQELFAKTLARFIPRKKGKGKARTTEIERQLLSRHMVKAVFKGIVDGKEPMLKVYPPQEPKQWAEFEIEQYIDYKKPGEYGDKEQTKFAFVVGDATPVVKKIVSSMKEGDKVKMTWHHDYVTTKDEGGGEMKSPERTVKFLEKIKPLTKPKFVKVSDIEPEQKGINVMVKCVSAPAVVEGDDDFKEVVLGDDTGIVTARVNASAASQLSACTPGASLRVQNSSVKMIKGFIRLNIDKWAVLKATDDTLDFEALSSKDVSATEYELS